MTSTSGAVEIDSVVEVANLYMVPATNKFTKLTIGAGCTLTNAWMMSSAYIIDAETGFTSLIMSGNHAQTQAEFIESASHGTLRIAKGALVRHQSDGTITTLKVMGGSFDTKKHPGPGFTITNSQLITGEINLSDVPDITLTNDLEYSEGVFRPPKGSTVNIS